MNFEGVTRSNYFRVKDVEAFKAWCERLIHGDVKVVEQDEDTDALTLALAERFSEKPRRVSIHCEEGELPTGILEDDETETDIDFFDELAKHLVDEVAIFISAGHEGMRYIGGWAYAINASGGWVKLNLNDIYEKAQILGTIASHAEY